MRVVSVDVGIENLALCVLEHGRPVVWEVVSISPAPRCGECGAKALQTRGSTYRCAACAKREGWLTVKDRPALGALSKLSDAQAAKLRKRMKVPPTADLRSSVRARTAKVCSATSYPMECYARRICTVMDPLVLPYRPGSIVLVENQLGRHNPLMKAVQGALTMYFVSRSFQDVRTVSPTRKLAHVPREKTATYGARKRVSVDEACRLLDERAQTSQREMLLAAPKKDDMADAFLQAMWFCGTAESAVDLE